MFRYFWRSSSNVTLVQRRRQWSRITFIRTCFVWLFTYTVLDREPFLQQTDSPDLPGRYHQRPCDIWQQNHKQTRHLWVFSRLFPSSPVFLAPLVLIICSLVSPEWFQHTNWKMLGKNSIPTYLFMLHTFTWRTKILCKRNRGTKAIRTTLLCYG